MLGTYISAALICAASLLVGRAILAALGRDRWSWLEPAVGFAALIAVPGLLVRLPAGDTVSSLVLVAMVVASVAALRIPYRLPRGVSAAGIWGGAAIALAVTAALSIPFAVSGHWGLIGMGFNNDLGLHLAWSEHLRSGFGPEPDSGYPLGPHGLAIAAAAFPSTALGQAFLGEVIAIGVLTGLTALGALGGLGPGRRVVAATLVAVTYLAASYFAQSAFKETAQALFVLAFAIGLPEAWPLPAGTRERLRAVAPLGILAAGIVFSYSFAGPGLAGRDRGALEPDRAGGAARPLAAAGRGLPHPPGDPRGGCGGRGARRPPRVRRPLRVRERLRQGRRQRHLRGGLPLRGARGLARCQLPARRARRRLRWPGSRRGSACSLWSWGSIWWLRRADLSVPIAFAACALLYVVSLPFSGDYSQAKALMIGAPLAMLISARALLGGPGTGWRARSTGGRVARAAYGSLAAVFLAGAAYSSFLVLREAPVAPRPPRRAPAAAGRDARQGRPLRGPGPLRGLRAAGRRHERPGRRVPRREGGRVVRPSRSTPASPTARSTSTPSRPSH